MAQAPVRSDIIENAIKAFWDSIAADHPEAELVAGEVNLGSLMDFGNAANKAVDSWLLSNRTKSFSNYNLSCFR